MEGTFVDKSARAELLKVFEREKRGELQQMVAAATDAAEASELARAASALWQVSTNGRVTSSMVRAARAKERLMNMVDDATSTTQSLFAAEETSFAAMAWLFCDLRAMDRRTFAVASVFFRVTKVVLEPQTV